MIFLAGLTILKKKRCLGIVSGCRGDPVVAFRLRNAEEIGLPTFGPHGRLSGWGFDPVVALPLRNAVDYRLPTFGPHGTKLGPS